MVAWPTLARWKAGASLLWLFWRLERAHHTLLWLFWRLQGSQHSHQRSSPTPCCTQRAECLVSDRDRSPPDAGSPPEIRQFRAASPGFLAAPPPAIRTGRAPSPRCGVTTPVQASKDSAKRRGGAGAGAARARRGEARAVRHGAKREKNPRRGFFSRALISGAARRPKAARLRVPPTPAGGRASPRRSATPATGVVTRGAIPAPAKDHWSHDHRYVEGRRKVDARHWMAGVPPVMAGVPPALAGVQGCGAAETDRLHRAAKRSPGSAEPPPCNDGPPTSRRPLDAAVRSGSTGLSQSTEAATATTLARAEHTGRLPRAARGARPWAGAKRGDGSAREGPAPRGLPSLCAAPPPATRTGRAPSPRCGVTTPVQASKDSAKRRGGAGAVAARERRGEARRVRHGAKREKNPRRGFFSRALISGAARRPKRGPAPCAANARGRQGEPAASAPPATGGVSRGAIPAPAKDHSSHDHRYVEGRRKVDARHWMAGVPPVMAGVQGCGAAETDRLHRAAKRSPGSAEPPPCNDRPPTSRRPLDAAVRSGSTGLSQSTEAATTTTLARAEHTGAVATRRPRAFAPLAAAPPWAGAKRGDGSAREGPAPRGLPSLWRIDRAAARHSHWSRAVTEVWSDHAVCRLPKTPPSSEGVRAPARRASGAVRAGASHPRRRVPRKNMAVFDFPCAQCECCHLCRQCWKKSSESNARPSWAAGGGRSNRGHAERGGTMVRMVKVFATLMVLASQARALPTPTPSTRLNPLLTQGGVHTGQFGEPAVGIHVQVPPDVSSHGKETVIVMADPGGTKPGTYVLSPA